MMEPKVFEMVPGSTASAWMIGILLVVTAGLAVLFGWIAYGARTGSVELSPDGLRVRMALYGRRVPLGALVREGARVLDLTRDPDHGPRLRTNGIGLPGYQAGWFRLRDGEKALLMVTDRRRVVYIPTREGYALLLSVKDPEGFLAELKRL